MKLIIAIIQPHRLEEVKAELYRAEVNLITVSEVLGHGRQKGVAEIYRGVKETGNRGQPLSSGEDFVDQLCSLREIEGLFFGQPQHTPRSRFRLEAVSCILPYAHAPLALSGTGLCREGGRGVRSVWVLHAANRE